MQAVFLLLGPLFLLIVIVPWCIGMGAETSENKRTVVFGMRAASITVLLFIGILLVVLGMFGINESRGTDAGIESPELILGVPAVGFGFLLCVAGGLALWAWGRKVSREPASFTFERRGDDTHCRKCGFQLIGLGGPCRRCDDVKTRPCISCGCYILPDDRTCPYCWADVG